MMKKFLTVLVLGLAVFAVSCGDDDPATITIGSIKDLVVSEVVTTGSGIDVANAWTATLTSTGSTATEVATALATPTAENIKAIFGKDPTYTAGQVFDSAAGVNASGVVTITITTKVSTDSSKGADFFLKVTCKGK